MGELLDAVAQTSPAATRAELAAAARTFKRATRSHVRAEQAETRALHSAARGIIQVGGALGRGEDGGITAMFLSTLVPGRHRRRPPALRPRPPTPVGDASLLRNELELPSGPHAIHYIRHPQELALRRIP
ncbi:hypothetical protein [Streptomyces sp. DW26H14]|uniref:hypothetical protein n=1 Tax=Streptomyces sp. DW26H14 TaxID=3435395 RepID=UPI00403DA21F